MMGSQALGLLSLFGEHILRVVLAWEPHSCASPCGDAGVSAALFAPGWVHEVGPEGLGYEGGAEGLGYEERQQEFWDRVEACCGGTMAAERRLPLPFHSDFNPGCNLAAQVLPVAPV